MVRTSAPHPLGGFADHVSCCALGRKGKFEENHCAVFLPAAAKAAGTWVCLAEKPYRKHHSFQDKLCDLMFAWELTPGADLRSAPLELKGGHIDVSDVRRQLQSGADIIDDLLKEIKRVTIVPLLVHLPFPSAERRMLAQQKVSFRGKPYPISTLRSGGRVDTLRW